MKIRGKFLVCTSVPETDSDLNFKYTYLEELEEFNTKKEANEYAESIRSNYKEEIVVVEA